MYWFACGQTFVPAFVPAQKQDKLCEKGLPLDQLFYFKRALLPLDCLDIAFPHCRLHVCLQTGWLLVVDVVALSMGIQTLGGVMSNVIPRNTAKPVKKTQRFSTVSDNQEIVAIKVCKACYWSCPWGSCKAHNSIDVLCCTCVHAQFISVLVGAVLHGIAML